MLSVFKRKKKEDHIFYSVIILFIPRKKLIYKLILLQDL